MTRITHEQAWADRQYLWQTYGPAQDMTGGYVDSEDLELLLKTPTKATAVRCLSRQIDYWFQVGPDLLGISQTDWQNDPRVHAIIRRYGCEDDAAAHGCELLEDADAQ